MFFIVRKNNIYLWVLFLKTVIFIKNALILTVTSLILRGFGIILKIWLAAKVGPEGIGLYQLIFSFQHSCNKTGFKRNTQRSFGNQACFVEGCSFDPPDCNNQLSSGFFWCRFHSKLFSQRLKSNRSAKDSQPFPSLYGCFVLL